MNKFYIDGNFWRHEIADGSMSKGDIIFETCYLILKDEDQSDWAYGAIEACSVLLLDGKRWPDRMSDNTDVNSWIGRIINRSLRKIGILKNPKFRFQGRMTRDPWIAFYTACLYLGEPGYIESVPIIWYLYSPKTWRWRRRLIKDNRKDYVIRLDSLRALAVTLNYKGT